MSKSHGFEGGYHNLQSMKQVRDKYLVMVDPKRPLTWTLATVAQNLSDEKMRANQKKADKRMGKQSRSSSQGDSTSGEAEERSLGGEKVANAERPNGASGEAKRPICRKIIYVDGSVAKFENFRTNVDNIK